MYKLGITYRAFALQKLVKEGKDYVGENLDELSNFDDVQLVPDFTVDDHWASLAGSYKEFFF